MVVSWTGKCKRSALEVVVTCSQSIPQAVARLQVGVIIGCTTMYNMSVTKKGCMRYHWVYEDVCYDVQDRLTWVFDPDSDEKEEAWNYWTIWDDHCSHAGNYSWWGIWASPDSNLAFYDDPGLTLTKEGQTVAFEINEHVERLLAGIIDGYSPVIVGSIY